MNKITELHNEAMALVDRSLVLKLQGELEPSNRLLHQAFEKESEAAQLVATEIQLEPTRSVLFRSAASLALQCGKTREAEKLISMGLSGQLPEEIAEELRDLLVEVYFERHLQLRGIILDPNDFRFSMSGPAVGTGIANSGQFIDRVKTVETIVYRFGERLAGKRYREHGRPVRKEKQEIELFVSVPQTGSFAVSFRIGSIAQMKLPGMDFSEKIIDELFDCFELFNSRQIEPLQKKIPDPTYYRNFVGLARNIAPDGENIKRVGLTTVRKGAPRHVILTTPQRQAPTIEPGILKEEGKDYAEVVGTLLYADALKGKRQIRLIDEKGNIHTVEVPEGMMRDIVRPLWEYKVIVRGVLRKKVIHLQEINKTE
jgi:hypothetical protein